MNRSPTAECNDRSYSSTLFHQRNDEQAIAKVIEIPELAESMRGQLRKLIKKAHH
ncbi:3-alpha domain-containing protein [Bacillus sp. N9]